MWEKQKICPPDVEDEYVYYLDGRNAIILTVEKEEVWRDAPNMHYCLSVSGMIAGIQTSKESLGFFGADTLNQAQAKALSETARRASKKSAYWTRILGLATDAAQKELN